MCEVPVICFYALVIFQALCPATLDSRPTQPQRKPWAKESSDLDVLVAIDEEDCGIALVLVSRMQ